MVAADRQRITVARDHPHVEILAGRRNPGGDSGGATVDGVHSVAVHVVGEARRAPDAGDHDGVLPGDAEVGHHGLEGGQDHVIAAARTPTHLLVAGVVLPGLRYLREGNPGESVHHSTSSESISAVRSASSSPTEMGSPRTRE